MSDDRSYEERKHAQEMRAAERAHDELTEHGNRINESATRDAQSAIRVLLAINGGAAVAILAKTRGDLPIDQLHMFTKSLLYFVFGALTAVVAAFFAYLTNFCNVGNALSRQRTWVYPYSTETSASKRYRIAARIFHILGILAAISGIVLFLLGMFRATRALSL